MKIACPVSKPFQLHRRLAYPRCATALITLALSVASGQAQAISRVPVINTVSGNGTPGYSGDNGLATSAQLNQPSGVAIDSAGNLYLADTANHRIREVAVGTGFISTVAGNGTAGYSGDNGPATAAELHSPVDIALDTAGNLFIADGGNSVIRKLSASGTITTVAGNNEVGFSGDNGPATSATLFTPSGVAVDSAGNLYIADTGNNRIRKVNSSGIITTLAGSGAAGYSGDNGPAASASLNQPSAVVVDSSGVLYIADTANQVVRQVSTAGAIITVAGNGTAAYAGDGGPATSASLNAPTGLVLDGFGNFYIADSANNAIRLVTAAGAIATVVGTGAAGFSVDGTSALSALLDAPNSVAVDSAGNLYVADQGNQRVRVISTPSGSLLFPTTQAGATSVALNIPLLVNASSTTISSIAALPSQNGLQEYTVTATGCALNTALAAGTVCNVTVTFNPAYAGVRSVPLQVTTSANVYSFGMAGVGTAPQAAISPGIINAFYAPYGDNYAGLYGQIAIDAAANVYVPVQAQESHIPLVFLMKVAAGTGVATLVPKFELSGSGYLGLALDSAGNIYTASPGYDCVFKYMPGSANLAIVAGVLVPNGGNGGLGAGYSGDGGLAVDAELNAPAGVAVDNSGNLYIADTGNNRIRKVFASGIITTIVGNGTGGYAGDNGPAAKAELNQPTAVVVDGAGNLYIADSKNSRIRMVNSSGIITTLAGNGTAGSNGDGGPATDAQLNLPATLALDAAGDVYIGDSSANVVRMVNAAGVISTLAGTGTLGYSGDGGPATSAQLNVSMGIALDSVGNLYTADPGTVRRVNGAASALNFASTQIGSGAMQVAELTDIGNAPLTFTAPASGRNPSLSPGFTQDSTSTCPQLTPASQPATLPSGSSCSLVVDFAPSGSAAITGTATIADNSLYQSALQTVQLSTAAGVTSATTTTLNVVTPIVGQTAVSATVAATAGTLVPPGTVAFTVDGAAQPTVTLDSTGTANLPQAVTNALGVGSHTIAAAYTSSSLGFGNSVATRIFSVSSVTPSVSMTGSASSLTVAQGGSVTDTLTITPLGGYTGTLQFACQGLPQNATCTFQPATVTLATGSQMTIVTIQAAGGSAELRAPNTTQPNNLPLLPAAAFCVPAFLLAACKRRLPSLRRCVVLSCLLFAAICLASGCGGASSPVSPTPPAKVTPVGTSTIEIIATASGSTVQSLSLTLTVKN